LPRPDEFHANRLCHIQGGIREHIQIGVEIQDVDFARECRRWENTSQQKTQREQKA